MTEPSGLPPAPYDVLFEPVAIGPVVAKNRFFQVPHCNGTGYRDPSAQAAKAEGGWAVVCTEQAEIHPTSDITPFIELRIWDDQDLPALARIAGAIHDGGALAGIELCHNGMNAPNLSSRETPLGPQHLPVASHGYDPVQARMMSKQDIAGLRRWHRNAVARAIQAGYDLVYVYSGHSFGGIEHFLSPRCNQRTDEYGGSARNRMRLLREILEDTLETAAGRAAVASPGTSRCRRSGARRTRPWARSSAATGTRSGSAPVAITLRISAALTAAGPGAVTVACTYTGQLSEVAADSVVMVTARLPDDELFLDLLAARELGGVTSPAPSATPGRRALPARGHPPARGARLTAAGPAPACG